MGNAASNKRVVRLCLEAPQESQTGNAIGRSGKNVSDNGGSDKSPDIQKTVTSNTGGARILSSATESGQPFSRHMTNEQNIFHTDSSKAFPEIPPNAKRPPVAPDQRMRHQNDIVRIPSYPDNSIRRTKDFPNTNRYAVRRSSLDSIPEKQMPERRLSLDVVPEKQVYPRPANVYATKSVPRYSDALRRFNFDYDVLAKSYSDPSTSRRRYGGMTSIPIHLQPQGKRPPTPFPDPAFQEKMPPDKYVPNFVASTDAVKLSVAKLGVIEDEELTPNREGKVPDQLQVATFSTPQNRENLVGYKLSI